MMREWELSTPLSLVEGGLFTVWDHALDLTVRRQRSTLVYPYRIHDQVGHEMFQIRRSRLGRRVLTDARGSLVVGSMGKPIPTLHRRQRVFDSSRKTLFSIKTRRAFHKPFTVLELFTNSTSTVPDFIIQGDFKTRNVDVVKLDSKEVVAKISTNRRSHFSGNLHVSKNLFWVSVPVGGDAAFAVLVAMALDNIVTEIRQVNDRDPTRKRRKRDIFHTIHPRSRKR
mmetsp:Transcript_12833/g.26037  ORF Transcript_12833/g.26037 Transcript_12833/m.26037 type:complete len:226 (-) Transcript_12833:329-1006(-)